MNPTIRTLLTSLMIAAAAPIGLAALDLEQSAFAKNGNGGGNGHGGGNGGGNNGGGHGKSSEAHGSAKGNAKTADAETDGDTEGEGLAPNELGKLNGVLHASPNAIANASSSSPNGMARELGEALADFLDSADEPAEGEQPAEGEETTDTPTIDELGEMMARMTNKPVTADQVQAVAEKLGIPTTDETPTDEEAAGEETTGEEQAAEGEDPTTDEPAALDQATAQEIADKANEIHGFDTGDDTGDTGGEDTADAGDTGDATLTN